MHSFEDEHHFIVFFSDYQSYEALEEISEVLVKLNFEVIRKVDGPDSRIWTMKIDDVFVELINDDPHGNFLRGNSPDAKQKLKDLYPRIKLYLF
jgi:hypothetical protein